MSTIDPIEFGRVLQKLDAIQQELHEFKERHIFRLDNIEERVEMLEKQQPLQSYWGKWVDKAILALVAAGAGAVGSKMWGGS